MKKQIFTLIAGMLISFSSGLKAQSFSVADTVWSTPSGSTTVLDVITNTSSNNDTIQWKVVASDFPADWQPLFSLCDNNICYSNGSPTAYTLWPGVGGPPALHTSATYLPSPPVGDFHMIVDLTSATSNGSHYVTVRLNPISNPTDTVYTTFVINKVSTAVQYVPKSIDDILLYPNPAREEVNIVYNAASDVKNIAVYNLIGKVMAVYKVTENNSANLNLENLPSGIYFARLINSQGNVVVTRKFTKQ